MLAVLKARAAYVPLDPGYPPDRLSYITSDAGVRMVLSRSHLAERAEPLAGTARLLHLDQAIEQIARQSWDRLGAGEVGEPADDLCYIVYTSGSTGRPKGVAIEHASICNFVRVAAEVYGMRPGDRVYQGMTIAFDFSVEGDLGALDDRRDARAQAGRGPGARAGAARVPAGPPGHRDVLRADPAGHAGRGPAGTALSGQMKKSAPARASRSTLTASVARIGP